MMDQDLTQQRSDLLRAIQNDRAKLTHAVDNLREVVQGRARLGQRMTQQPYRWLGAGIIFGLLLGLHKEKT